MCKSDQKTIADQQAEIDLLKKSGSCSVLKERDFWKTKYEESEQKYRDMIEERRRELIE